MKNRWTSLFFTLAMIAAGLFIAALAVAQSNDVKRRSNAAPAGAATTKQNNTSPSATGQAKTKILPTAPTALSGDADAKKHLAGVKYEDRQASGVQTLDGASKDAAKSDTAPVKTGGSQGASSAQDSRKQ